MEAMCAVLHKHRPPPVVERGGFMVTEVTETATGPGSTVFDPSLGTLLGTWGFLSQCIENPTTT